jgi:hypothetical protein
MTSSSGSGLSRIAGIYCAIQVFASIAAGIAIFATNVSLIGFVWAAVIVAIGIVTAILIGRFMDCIGEMTDNSAETKRLMGQLQIAAAAPPQANKTPAEFTSDQTPDGKATDIPENSDKKDNSNNKLYFDSRTSSIVKCLLCEAEQLGNRDFCCRCKCQFLYRDEHH